jgi:superfamily II DNA/RNA helicase
MICRNLARLIRSVLQRAVACRQLNLVSCHDGNFIPRTDCDRVGRSAGILRAGQAIAFAAEGKVCAEIRKSKLEDVNKVFADLKAGTVNGRAVLVM